MDWIRRKKRAPSPAKSPTSDETIAESQTDEVNSAVNTVAQESEKCQREEKFADDGMQRTTSAVSTDSNIVYPTGLPLAIVVISLCFAIFLVALDQTIIATAMYYLSTTSLTVQTSHNQSIPLARGRRMVCIRISLDDDRSTANIRKNLPKLQFESRLPRGGVDFRAGFSNLRRSSE